MLTDGRRVEAVTLSNANGMTVRILSFGALVQALEVPDSKGVKADVVFGYPDLKGYLDNPSYFGVAVSRYANRIAGGSFALDGKRYVLARNNGPNSLHGGTLGFGKKLWSIADVVNGPTAAVTLSYVSSDGEEDYPGLGCFEQPRPIRWTNATT